VIGLEDIEAAREAIGPRLHPTPTVGSETLGKLTGARVFLKAELFQKTGSFKPRGVLTNLGVGSPNLLLYTGTLSSWASVTSPTPTTSNPPTASFTASCSKSSCAFDGSGSTDDIRIASYAWDFGDGTPLVSSSSAATTHAYVASGAYTVVLRVTDSAGRLAKTSKTVRPKRP